MLHFKAEHKDDCLGMSDEQLMARVRRQVKRMHQRQFWTFELEELESAGMIGLAKALRKRDRYGHFAALVSCCVHGEVLNYIRSITHYRANRPFTYEIPVSIDEGLVDATDRGMAAARIEQRILAEQVIGQQCAVVQELARRVLNGTNPTAYYDDAALRKIKRLLAA